MRIFYLTLALFACFSVLEAEEQLGQVSLPPFNPLYSRRIIEDRLRALQSQNAQLRQQIQQLEPYRYAATILQQQLTLSEQQLLNTKQQLAQVLQSNKGLQDSLQRVSLSEKQKISALQESQSQLQSFTQQMKTLVKEREACTGELLKSQDQIRQSIEQKRQMEQALSDAQKMEKDLQTAKSQVDQQLKAKNDQAVEAERVISVLRQYKNVAEQQIQSLKAAYNSVQNHLSDLEQQLSAAKQNLGQQTASNRELATLKAQIQSLQLDLEKNRTILSSYRQENDTYAYTKANLEQELKDKTSRLATLEKMVKEAQDNEKQYQATIDEKVASLAKWRETNALLKAQLDTALSFNDQLRQQLEKCEKSNKR